MFLRKRKRLDSVTIKLILFDLKCVILLYSAELNDFYWSKSQHLNIIIYKTGPSHDLKT